MKISMYFLPRKLVLILSSFDVFQANTYPQCHEFSLFIFMIHLGGLSTNRLPQFLFLTGFQSLFDSCPFSLGSQALWCFTKIQKFKDSYIVPGIFSIFIYVSIVWVLRQTLRPSGDMYTETSLEYIKSGFLFTTSSKVFRSQRSRRK